MDKVDDLGQRITGVLLLTNTAFKADLEKWKDCRNDDRINVFDDGSANESLGEENTFRFVMPVQHDDLLVSAADSLFVDDLSGIVALHEKTGNAVVGLYPPSSADKLLRGPAASVDEAGVITEFIESPNAGEASLVGAVMYVFPARIRERFVEYLSKGFWTDAPSKFIGWLVTKEIVNGYRLENGVWDIATPEAYAGAARYLRTIV
jgi:NDP-sugar pyrophosphorylase family protein